MYLIIIHISQNNSSQIIESGFEHPFFELAYQ